MTTFASDFVISKNVDIGLNKILLWKNIDFGKDQASFDAKYVSYCQTLIVLLQSMKNIFFFQTNVNFYKTGNSGMVADRPYVRVKA